MPNDPRIPIIHQPDNARVPLVEMKRCGEQSDEEVLAQARAEGLDPQKIAATGRMMLETVLWGRSPSLFCRIGKCRSVAPYDDEDGVGGKCTNCGRIHGWVTRDELRRYAEAIQKAEGRS